MNEQTLAAMQEARNAISSGDVARARQLLRRIVQEDETNYRAWLWLAGITESPTASLEYVQRAVDLAPDDPTVQDALRWAERRVRDAAPANGAESARLVARRPAAPQRPPAAAPAAPHPPPQQAMQAATLRPASAQSRTESARRDDTPPADEPPRTIRRRVSDRGAPADADMPVAAWPAWLQWIAYVALVVLVVLLVLYVLQRWGGERALLPVRDQLRLLTPAAEQVAGLPQPSPSPTLPLLRPTLGGQAAPDSLPPVATPAALARAPLRPKQGVRAADLPAWTPTPTPTPLPTATLPPDVDPQLFNERRWIDVNLTTQSLTAFEDGRVVYRTAVSSGLPGTPTVVGQFRIYLRLATQNMSGYHLGFDYFIPNVPYVMYFYDNFALHGAYWHNNFGQPMSHGCVNLAPVDAEWLFNFADVGTLVNVHY